MPVTWSWKRKHGEVFIKQDTGRGIKTFKCNLYFGNCLGVIIYEFKDPETKKDKYQFVSFFNDITHLKNCLGQTKDYKENILVDRFDKYVKVRINTFWWKDSYTRKEDMKMIEAFSKGGIKVELYYKEV